MMKAKLKIGEKYAKIYKICCSSCKGPLNSTYLDIVASNDKLVGVYKISHVNELTDDMGLVEEATGKELYNLYKPQGVVICSYSCYYCGSNNNVIINFKDGLATKLESE